MSPILSRTSRHRAGEEEAGVAVHGPQAPDRPTETEPHHARRPARWAAWPGKGGQVLISEGLLKLAAELIDATAEGDAESLAAIAWQLYGEAGENLAEMARLRAAIHAAWNQPQQKAIASSRCRLSGPLARAAPPGGDPGMPAAGAATSQA